MNRSIADASAALSLLCATPPVAAAARTSCIRKVSGCDACPTCHAPGS